MLLNILFELRKITDFVFPWEGGGEESCEAFRPGVQCMQEEVSNATPHRITQLSSPGKGREEEKKFSFSLSADHLCPPSP